MYKLTTEQKITMYEKMIKTIQKTNYCGGFCDAFVCNTVWYNSDDMLKVLPELKKYKPHKTIIDYYNGYWFDNDDNEIRLIILKEIIKNLKRR